MQTFDRNQMSVKVSVFRFQVSAQALAGDAASLIGKETVEKRISNIESRRGVKCRMSKE
jgi:hypothetical protein